MAEMLNKITRYNKNVKLLMDLMNKVIEKLDIYIYISENKFAENNDADAEKERMDNMFEAKKIGRLVGTFETKQQQYLKLLNEGKKIWAGMLCH